MFHFLPWQRRRPACPLPCSGSLRVCGSATGKCKDVGLTSCVSHRKPISPQMVPPRSLARSTRICLSESSVLWTLARKLVCAILAGHRTFRSQCPAARSNSCHRLLHTSSELGVCTLLQCMSYTRRHNKWPLLSTHRCTSKCPDTPC